MKQKAHDANQQHAHPTNARPSNDQVAERAYEFFRARGGTDGHDVEDWLRAEDELRAAES